MVKANFNLKSGLFSLLCYMHTWTFAFLLDAIPNRVAVEIARTNLTYRRIKRSRVKKKEGFFIWYNSSSPSEKKGRSKRNKKFVAILFFFFNSLPHMDIRMRAHINRSHNKISFLTYYLHIFAYKYT